jgi:hypothetical protein
MQNLFKQIWPMIKNKVSDPTTLLKQINNGEEPIDQEEFGKLRQQN